jgi:hypothetical protein
VGSGFGLDRCGKSRPIGIRSPDLPDRSESLYRLSYPGSCPSMYLFIRRVKVNVMPNLSYIPVGVLRLSTKFRNSLFREATGTLSKSSADRQLSSFFLH